MQQGQEKALEKLTQHGLLEKHEQLAAEGFNFPWRNFAILKKFDGNVEKVKEHYANHHKEQEEKDKAALQALEKLGYIDQHQTLQKQGYERPARNLKVLIRFSGNLQQVEEFLKQKKENCQEFMGKFRGGEFMGKCRGGEFRKKKCEFIAQLYPQQLEKLNELGFTDQKKNCKLLRKFDGNLEAVLAKYMKWNKEVKFARIQKLKLDPQFQERKKQLKEKVQVLKDNGLKARKSIKLLAMFNGDMQQILKLIKDEQTPQC